MPLWTPFNHYTYRVDNWGTDPSAFPGTTISPGASDAEGSWTQVLAAVAEELGLLMVRVANGFTATNIKNHVMDIGIDPAGGTSYTAIISDILCGESSATTSASGVGHQFLFPFRIPDGATVAVRIQGSNSTAGTLQVDVRGYGLPSAPWMMPVGQYSETLGVSGSSGTSITPGNAADGAWVSLGTTTRECWWAQLCYQLANGTITAEYTYIDLAYGDASNKHILLRRMHGGATSENIGSVINENLLFPAAYCRIPAGSTLYVRGRCNNNPDSGYQAAAVLIGG